MKRIILVITKEKLNTLCPEFKIIKMLDAKIEPRTRRLKIIVETPETNEDIK